MEETVYMISTDDGCYTLMKHENGTAYFWKPVDQKWEADNYGCLGYFIGFDSGKTISKEDAVKIMKENTHEGRKKAAMELAKK